MSLAAGGERERERERERETFKFIRNYDRELQALRVRAAPLSPVVGQSDFARQCKLHINKETHTNGENSAQDLMLRAK